MKRFLIPLLATLTLPTAVNANLDPKIAEICMKATDFQGCVKSISGQKNNNLSNKFRQHLVHTFQGLKSIYNKGQLAPFFYEEIFNTFISYYCTTYCC